MASQQLSVYLPDELCQWLTALARSERRSVNAQVIVLLEAAQGASQSRARSAAQSARATRLPDDFEVTPAMVSWARDHVPGLIAAGRGRAETENFQDYWRQAAGRTASKRDWVAAWRFWMRKAEDDLAPARRPTRQQETDDQFARAMQRINAREESGRDATGNGAARPVRQIALPPADD